GRKALITGGDSGMGRAAADHCLPNVDPARPALARIAAGERRLSSLQPARPAIALLAMIGRRVHFAGEAGPRLRLLFVGRLRVFVAGIAQFLLLLVGGHGAFPSSMTGNDEERTSAG